MARHYGTVATAIWGDPDFQTLSSNAQRTYLMLITQPGITSVGTLAITLRRWSRYAPDSTSDSLSNGLSELADSLFVVVDWDREELLVRTFVRWDGGHTNPKRLAAINSAAKAVDSPLLSGVLAHELSKLNVTHEITTRPIDVHDIAYRPNLDSPRVVVTEVGTSTTHNPQPDSTTQKTSAPATPERLRHSYPEDFEAFWDKYPKKRGKDAALKAWKSATRRAPLSEIIAGAVAYAKLPKRLAKPEYTMDASTWLNGGHWSDEPETGAPINGQRYFGKPGERRSMV